MATQFASSAVDSLSSDIFLDPNVPNLYVKGKYTRINGTIVKKPTWLMSASKDLGARDVMRNYLNNTGNNDLDAITTNSESPNDALRDAQQFMQATNTTAEDDGTILQGWLMRMTYMDARQMVDYYKSLLDQLNAMPESPNKLKYVSAMNILRGYFATQKIYEVVNDIRQAHDNGIMTTGALDEYRGSINNLTPEQPMPTGWIGYPGDMDMHILPSVQNPAGPTTEDLHLMQHELRMNAQNTYPGSAQYQAYTVQPTPQQTQRVFPMTPTPPKTSTQVSQTTNPQPPIPFDLPPQVPDTPQHQFAVPGYVAPTPQSGVDMIPETPETAYEKPPESPRSHSETEARKESSNEASSSKKKSKHSPAKTKRSTRSNTSRRPN